MGKNRAVSALGALMLTLSLGEFANWGFSQDQPKAPVIPDKYTNLKVLPQDITKAELLPIMKGFCKSSGHRCSYCHVATDDLSSADFASDEKPAKSEARELLRLIRTLK
jgi:hypothetical protein